MLKIQVIVGSTRQERFSDKPAGWIFDILKERKDVKAELIDLRDWKLPFFDEPSSPSTSGGKYTNPLGTKWADKIGEADGYIIVTPEYNHGYPAVLKNALDYVYKQWNNKPVSFVSYGGISGGTRSVQQLRLVVIELQMVPIRNGVHIPFYWSKMDDRGQLVPEEMERFKNSSEAMIDQLLWWADTLKPAREKS